jgi:pyruvate,water dikinase
MPLPEDFRGAVISALDAAGLRSVRLAVRSSAVDEDGSRASYAGQFDSVLGVRADGPADELWDALRRVWASAFNPHAAAYRERNDGANAARMAVILQELVDASVAGVAFSADPVSASSDTAVVCAVYGLGEGLVSGEFDADTYRVTFAGESAGEVRGEIATKNRAVRPAEAGGTRIESVREAEWNAPAIEDEEARRIATCARRLATEFGAPQDVEWALVSHPGERRRLVVLQSRPITALGQVRRAGAPGAQGEVGAAAASRTGERRIWDNSNIIESYSGVTTPLTFSFARSVYEEVYRQFCELMGVGGDLIGQHREMFANMIGLVRGRVYYNLLNWYRMLALLPGFQFNRAFMEGMMGVRERLEDPPEPPSAGSRLRDLVRLVRMAVRMVREERRLETGVPAFRARVGQALAPFAGQDLAGWPADEVVALYRRLEDQLLRHWQVPLVNDFFAMMHFGVLRRLIEKWLPDSPSTQANDLLCGEGGIISTEPARAVMALARQVADSPELSERFATQPDDHALWRRIEADPACAPLLAGMRAYVERFGDRCMEELKLETVTLHEDPSFVVQMIRAYAVRGTIDPEAARAREVRIRREAEAAVKARLAGLRRAVFFWVLRRARARVRDRENLRFERTRVFGLVRRIFLALGASLAADGRLETPRDVFYLTREEIFSYFSGAAVTLDLKALVRVRRAEFADWQRGVPPPDRFETLGPPGAHAQAPVAKRAAAATGGVLRGTGCCPGVVRAPVRVVRDPRQARDLPGHILVAERTDPGWTLLFPAAQGLLVERGSLLSHSAIVAREMGLPCVVGITGLLDTLADGETVEMDGTSGVVRRLEA